MLHTVLLHNHSFYHLQCETTYKTTYTTKYDKKCTTHYKEHCEEHGYGYHKEYKCHKEPVHKCHEVPIKVPHKIPKKHCFQGDLSRSIDTKTVSDKEFQFVYFSVQLSNYFVQNLYFDNKMKNL